MLHASLLSESGQHATPQVPLGVTLFFCVLLVAMIVALAFEEKIHAKKSLIVGVFASFCLALASYYHLLPIGAITLPGGHQVHMPV